MLEALAQGSRIYVSTLKLATTPAKSQTIFWAHSTSEGLIGIQSLDTSDRKRVVIAPSPSAGPTPLAEDLIHKGSGFASAVLPSGYEYIFWISTNSAIQARRYSPGST